MAVEVLDLGGGQIEIIEEDTCYVVVEDVGLQGPPGGGGGSSTWGSITGTLSNQTDLQSALDAKEASISAGTTSQYWRGDKSWQTLDKSAVGLSNVDNTSDANKPVSTAQAAALLASQNGLITQAAILSINGGDNTKFDVAAGTAIIDGASVSWNASSAVTVTNLATATRSYIFIDGNGDIVQSTTAPTPETRRTHLFLGQLGHTNNTTINSVSNTPSVHKNPDDQMRDILDALGIYNVSGNDVSYNGANLNINISSGSLLGNGINWENDEYSPNIKSFSQLIAPTFRHRTQTGAGSSTSTLDVANYDNAGTITAVGGGTNASQNFRVYRTVAGNIVIQYGQQFYTSLDAAIAAIDTESFVEFSNLSEVGCFIGIISVKKTATDLSDSSQARFFRAVRLGSSTVVNDLSEYLTLVTAASTSNGEGASLIGIEDSGGLYSATTVEGALAEVATNVNGKQAADSDLTTIAGLSPTNDDFLQYKSSAWANRTISQVKTDLGLTGTNSGDQTITLTGDVTGSGTGSFAATVKSNLKTHPITLTIDGAGSAITTGVKAYWSCPYDCTIQSVTMLADVSGSAVVDIWKDTYANYPPTDADSITASAVPTISAATKSTDATLTGWTTSISAGDILAFNVDSASTITKLTLVLGVVKT